MLAGQPKPQEVFASFRQFFGDSTLVAHNVDFDVWFLRYEYWRVGHTLINRHKCTLKLSRKRYPGLPDYKLETVARHVLGEEVDKGRRHRALDDARLAARIWMSDLPDYFRYWGKADPNYPCEPDWQSPVYQCLCVRTVAGNKKQRRCTWISIK